MEIIRTNGQLDEKIIESLIIHGDISKLDPKQKVQYYKIFCERLGLDPVAQPFQILKLQGKEILYLVRSGAQQLNKLYHVSHEVRAREVINDLYVVTSRASTPEGRFTDSIGAVNIANLKGDTLANAMMKAETKSKRRATLDLLGLGLLDETETETIPHAQTIELTAEDISQRVDDSLEAVEKVKGFKSVGELDDWWKSLDDIHRKKYRELVEANKYEFYKKDIFGVIKKLKTNTWQTNQTTIEHIIDEEKDLAKKKEIIDAYNDRLEYLKVDYKFEPLPF
jgi:hypothetical protein